MALADDLLSEAEALDRVAASREKHAATIDGETEAILRRGEALEDLGRPSDTGGPGGPRWAGRGGALGEPPGPGGPQPPPDPTSGGPGGPGGVTMEKSVATFHTAAGQLPSTPFQNAGDAGAGTFTPQVFTPNDGPGVSGGHATGAFQGSTLLSAYGHLDLKAGVAWVEAHCTMTTIKIPDPSARFDSLDSVKMVDLPVWDCRAAMHNADALFVPAGAWEALAKSTSKLGAGVGAGAGSSSPASGGGSGGIKSPPGPPIFGGPGGPLVAPPPATQGGQKLVVQTPSAPTPGESAIARLLATQTATLERIARAAERQDDGLALRRAARI